ncbi:flavin reductase family protein [Aquabacter spiritensis]|uniref:Flavin reductase (DIM6/NTAB) family NADH-FMN oxidoreductase RutF n=1 Tax=Aquabacter spiritensis TaxID=933073 RepID=A0A4V2UYK7_9HYPH|nr:flavin reductase family protein [Aquabacter spiritensis]TCT07788.1 flavin reductase (DIM6/NTAB) family NADH-FMN oxidoreductase RutF [Aquabacter spiritensis]
MFYEPEKRDHGLPFSPLKAIVAPRPIGWISTLSAAGVTNLAPYSFFNLISEDPALVMFSSVGRKHSVVNIEATGEFVCNLATLALIDAVNISSADLPADRSEFDHAGLDPAPSRLVKPPRVAAAPCALECVYVETLRPKDRHGRTVDRHVVIGEVIGVHIDDAVVHDGRVDTALMGALARCGYMDFSVVDAVVERLRPGSVR